MFLVFGLLLGCVASVAVADEKPFAYNANLTSEGCRVVDKMRAIDPRLAESCNTNSKLSNWKTCDRNLWELYSSSSPSILYRDDLFQDSFKEELDACAANTDPIMYNECVDVQRAKWNATLKKLKIAVENGEFKNSGDTVLLNDAPRSFKGIVYYALGRLLPSKYI